MEQGKKISELERIPSLTGDEVIPIVHEGRNYKMSVNDIVEFSGGKSSGALPKDIPVGNTDLGDALLSVADNSEIVRLQYLDKSAKKLKAGTPYDLLFSALLYTEREAYQPTVSISQGAISFKTTNNGSISIGDIGTPKPGDEVSFDVTYTAGAVTKSNSSISITNGYGYATKADLSDVVSGATHTITKTPNVSTTQNAALTVKHNGTTLTSVSNSGNKYTYKYTAVAGSNSITASVVQAKYSGTIDKIEIWPLDERGNLAKAYPNGAKTNAVSETNLGGNTLTATSKSVTAKFPVYVQYKDSTPIEIKYNATPNPAANSDGTPKEYTLLLELPASSTNAVHVLIPKTLSKSNIHTWFWDSISGWQVASPTWEGPTDYTHQGVTYSKYTSQTRQTMPASSYFITIND